MPKLTINIEDDDISDLRAQPLKKDIRRRTPPSQTPIWDAAKRRKSLDRRHALGMSEEQYKKIKDICNRSPIKFVRGTSEHDGVPLARALFTD